MLRERRGRLGLPATERGRVRGARAERSRALNMMANGEPSGFVESGLWWHDPRLFPGLFLYSWDL